MKIILYEKVVYIMSVVEQKQRLAELWEEFINNLAREGFDADLEKYLKAIKCLAEIDVSKVDDEKYRGDIEKHIDEIVAFIERYKDNYYEISCIKGFKKYENTHISGRDYYYYLSDQQVKASVYYVRYLNFLERSQFEETRRTEMIQNINRYKNFLNEQVTIDADLKTECEDLIKEIEKILYESEKLLDTKKSSNGHDTYSMDIEYMKQKCIQYLDEIKLSSDIEYKKYMMFNNMMREIRFWGAAHQYLWHWKKEKKTLYRCGTLESKNEKNTTETKQEYVKNMFTSCISHMNSPSDISHSYSENLLLDIYKYLVLPKQEESNKESTCMLAEDEIHITSRLLNNNTVVFNIIKEADVNCIFVNDEAKSFHEFMVGENPENYDLPYIVEMYPRSLEGEKNDKGTTKGMRDWLLPAYFNSWGIYCNFSKTKVSDDKEVITYRKCYSEKMNVDENPDCIYKDYNPGTLFSMVLNKEDIIYLLLKIFEQKQKRIDSIKEIVDKIVENLLWEDKYPAFVDCYRNNQEYEFKAKFSKDNVIGLLFEGVIRGTHFEENNYLDENKKKIPVDAAKRNCKEQIKSKIKAYLKERYNRIYAAKHTKSDFILTTMRKDGYCFDLIKKYNEYLIGDEEITMLKHLIFKG